MESYFGAEFTGILEEADCESDDSGELTREFFVPEKTTVDAVFAQVSPQCTYHPGTLSAWKYGCSLGVGPEIFHQAGGWQFAANQLDVIARQFRTGRGEFAGKAEGVGGGAEKGKVSFSGKVPVIGTPDLRVATVTVTALLREIGGGELVRGGGGAPFLPVTLRPRRGSKATAAIFETPAGVRPSVEIEVKQRDPKKAEVEFSLKVDRASIPLTPKGCDLQGGNAVPLGTRVAIEDSSRKSLEVTPELSWRCGRNALRTP